MSTQEDEAHSICITSQGKIKNWVSFALKSFQVRIHPEETHRHGLLTIHSLHAQENPDLPLAFHTIPPTPSTSKLNPKDANNAQKHKLASSTALAPRLVSVVEIVKREYMKNLKERKASRMKGLYQYNDIGTLEEEQGDGAGAGEAAEESKEERRAEKIIEALSGKNQ